MWVFTDAYEEYVHRKMTGTPAEVVGGRHAILLALQTGMAAFMQAWRQRAGRYGVVKGLEYLSPRNRRLERP